jgi:UDP-glucose 4-epimerase
MTILIIGSEGFIGSHCRDYFLNKKYKVISCDLPNLEISDYYSLNNINGNYDVLFKSYKFDFCINAAGSANVSYSYNNPENDFELNVSLLVKLLAAINRNNPDCKLINFSSAAVYGNPNSLPVKESDLLMPVSPYGYHKMLSEKILLEYNKIFGLKTCSLRVFSAYGPRLCKQLFWDLYQQSKLSSNIELFGSGLETRDFIYISDLIKALELTMINSSFNGEVINVASGIETSIKTAAEIFVSNLYNPTVVQFTGIKKLGDPDNWRADLCILHSWNFRPEVSLEKGLQNYVNWLIDAFLE